MFPRVADSDLEFLRKLRERSWFCFFVPVMLLHNDEQ